MGNVSAWAGVTPREEEGRRSEIKPLPFSVQGHGNKIIQNGTFNGNFRAVGYRELC